MEEKIINEEEGLDSNSTPELIQINDNARNTIYICLILVSAFSSCDGGVIPQQTEKIKENFGGGDSRVGLFGSIDYIGRVIGALILAVIMGKMNRKMLLVSSLIFKAITLMIALLTDNFYVNTIARAASGLSQVFYTTYLPVWCDQYGKKDKKAIMVTLVQLGNPIGIIVGYGLGLFIQSFSSDDKNYWEWRIAFGIEGIILILTAFVIFSFQPKYFSNNFILVNDNQGKEENDDKQKNTNIFSNFGKILCNKLFLFTTLSNSVAFFGMSVIQYWGDKYMDKILKMETTPRFIAFGSLCLLGPIVGMVFGGIICSKLGGYGKKKSMVFIILLTLFSSIISSLIAISNPFFFVGTAWSFLFFICATIPPESGIIISSLDNNLRGDGFALSNSILNLFGSFPASYVFSLLSDIFEDIISEEKKKNYEQYRYAWMVSMGYNFVGLLFIIIAGIFRFKIEGDLSSDESEEKEKSDSQEVTAINQ
jgi:predicted MFS family arabinose efflux permease